MITNVKQGRITLSTREARSWELPEGLELRLFASTLAHDMLASAPELQFIEILSPALGMLRRAIACVRRGDGAS